MTIDDKLRDEKLQYDIYKEAAKVSVLSSAKNDKYDHLKDEEILPSNQRQIIKQTKFTCSRLGKPFGKNKEKWLKIKKKNKRTTKQSWEKVFRHKSKTNYLFFSKGFLNEDAKYELNKVVELEIKSREITWFIKKLIKNNKSYDFQNFKTIRSFGRKLWFINT